MRKVRNTAGLLIALASLKLMAQPVVATGGIVHAADNSSSAPGSGLPQGGLFTIYGLRLGTTAQATALPLATALGGAQVNIRSANGTTYPAPLYLVTTGQINALLPSNVPIGNASLTVTVGTQTSAAQPIAVVAARFGILTVNSSGAGPGIVQNYDTATQLPTLNGFSRPARSGQTLILWGIGLGAYTAGPDTQAPVAGNIGGGVEVLVGSRTIQPVYAGRAPGVPGVDQVNFVMPAEVEDTCFVPVQIKAGGVLSNLVTVAKGSSASCVEPFGFSSAQRDSLERGGLLKTGFFELRIEVASGELGLISTREEIASIGLTTNGTSEFAQMRGGPFVPPMAGAATGCSVDRREIRVDKPYTVTQTGAVLSSQNNDLQLTASGKSKEANGYGDTKVGSANEIRLPGAPPISAGEPFYATGTVNVQYGGGPRLPAFSMAQNVEDFLALDLPDSAYITNFGVPYPVRWKTAGTKPDDLVGVALYRSSDDGRNSTAIRCVTSRVAGSFTIPAETMAQLPRGGFPAVLVVYGSSRSTVNGNPSGLDALINLQTAHAQATIAIR